MSGHFNLEIDDATATAHIDGSESGPQGLAII